MGYGYAPSGSVDKGALDAREMCLELNAWELSFSLGDVDVLKGVCDRACDSGRSGSGGGSCRGLLALALLALALALTLLLASVLLASGSGGLGGALALVVGIALLELLIVLDLVVDILLVNITSADGGLSRG